MPEPLRGDVRLLGSLLGNVLVEYGGQGLLDDVERLRGTRDRRPSRRDDVRRRRRDRRRLADCDARRAGRPRVHRLLPPDEPRRGAPAGPHAAGAGRRRDAAGSVSARAPAWPRSARSEPASCWPTWSSTRCSPRTRPRRAAARSSTAIRRISELLTDRRRPARGRERARRDPAGCSRRSTCCGARRSCAARSRTRSTRCAPPWRSSTRRCSGVVAARLPPLDAALAGPDRGRRPPLAPAVRAAAAAGSAATATATRYVTAAITREAVDIQADHVLRGAGERLRPRSARDADPADDRLTPPSAGAAARCSAPPAPASPELIAEIAKRSPGEPHRQVLLVAAERIAATRRRDADLAYAGPADLLADLRRRAGVARGAPARPRRRTASCSS